MGVQINAGMSSFQGWICVIKHTLGHFKVSLIQGCPNLSCPHLRGKFVL